MYNSTISGSFVHLGLDIEKILFFDWIQIFVLFEVAKVLLGDISFHELFIILMWIFSPPCVYVIYWASLPRWWKMNTVLIFGLLLICLLTRLYLEIFIHFLYGAIRRVILAALFKSSQHWLVIHFSLLEKFLVSSYWCRARIIIVVMHCFAFQLAIFLLGFNV